MDTTRHCGLLLLIAATAALPAQAQQFSAAEPQLQNGDLRVPEFAESGIDRTVIGTFQRVNGDDRVDLSVFADLSKGNHLGKNQRTDRSRGSEPSVNLGASKILQARYGDEARQDIGLMAAIHYRADTQGLKGPLANGVSMPVPESSGINPDATRSLHAGKGRVDASAPKEPGSVAIDLSIASKSFQIGTQHSAGEFGEATPSPRVLSRPQMLRNQADAGLSEKRGQLLVDTDYQFWSNKFEKNSDESAQGHTVWKF